jgi:two-component system invasion response regulator UvrY
MIDKVITVADKSKTAAVDKVRGTAGNKSGKAIVDRTIGVMLVDDHAVVRMGFRLLLEGASDITVLGEAESGEEAVRRFAELNPDVVVMDISMPGIGGLEAIERILAKQPNIRILVLSAHEDAMHARRVLKAGAAGYLTKRSAAEELIHAIAVVHQGKTYLEPGIAQQMAMQQLSGERNPVDTLSEKEFKVFLALAKGQSVQDIADVMSLSPRTVGTHLYNIKQKLGASNSAELAIIAIRAKLIDP